jgi:iron complex transport system permease protein
MQRKDSRNMIVLIGILLLVGFASLMVGSEFISPMDMVRWLFYRDAGNEEYLNALILSEIRAPRLVLAVLIGFALGLSGASVQGLLQNGLAEPSILGAANSAALGAVVAIYIGLTGTLSFAVPLMASVGALVSVILLFTLAGQRGDTLRLILAGFAISAFAGSGISLTLNLSDNYFAALEITYWLLGSLENRSWSHVGLALPLIFVGCGLMLSGGKKLDALILGEDTAFSLGANIFQIRGQLAIGMALAIGGAVAVAGVIGFVGLVAPHIMRPFFGYMPSRALLPSAIFGSILLVAADLLIRLLPTMTELKLGVVTALLGVPFFIYLLLRGRGLARST